MTKKKTTQKKSDTVSITSTKISLNLKGVKVDLTIDELRHLRYLINRTLGEYTLSNPWYGGLSVTNVACDPSLGNPVVANSCSEITLDSSNFDLDNRVSVTLNGGNNE